MQVHSFYVNEYLRGYMYLDEYSDYLTLKQKLYLYRNIDRIYRYVGRQDTFEELIKILLIDRSIPLTTYTLSPNLQALEEKKGDVEYLATEVTLTSTADTNIVLTKSITDLVSLFDSLAPGNKDVSSEEIVNVENLMARSKMIDTPTKLLASKVVDTSNFTNYTIEDIAMNEWIRMVGDGRYLASYVGSHPITGETLEYDSKTAFLIYYYLVNYTYGIVCQNIPTFDAFSCRVEIIPSYDTLSGRINNKYDKSAILETIAYGHPDVGVYSSAYDFYTFCTEVFNKNTEIKDAIANIENMHFRGQAEAAQTLLYTRKHYVFESGDFTAYVNAQGIDPTEFTSEQIDTLISDILEQLTGIVENKSTQLVEVQAAMISIMKKLTSYGTTFYSSVNVDGMMQSDWPTLRIGDISLNETHDGYVPDLADARDLTISDSYGGKLNITLSGLDISESITHHAGTADPTLITISNTNETVHYIGELKDLGLNVTEVAL